MMDEVTDNARLLLGFIAGAVAVQTDEKFGYRLVDLDTAAGFQTMEHVQTGSLFRINVSQIGGER